MVSALMLFKILYLALVLFGGLAGVKGSEIPAFTGLWILLF